MFLPEGNVVRELITNENGLDVLTWLITNFLSFHFNFSTGNMKFAESMG